MRVFVSEYVCSGAWPEAEIGGSLAVEGRAMLEAILVDFAKIPGMEVWTTWDRRLGGPAVPGVHWEVVSSPEAEKNQFAALSAECEATFIIAPEFDGILLSRCRTVERAGGRLLGTNSRGVELSADKLRTADWLRNFEVPTIPTSEFDPSSPTDALRFPQVIKPRDGAGSQSTFLITGRGEFPRILDELRRETSPHPMIQQPFVAGKSVSVGLLVAPEPHSVEVFPVAEQALSNDGRFRYVGGWIPARCRNSQAVLETAATASTWIPGLCGYVGVDLIVPDDAPERPVVVEINPRLTTSYLGYRALTDENLAERMLFPKRFNGPVKWKQGAVEFDPAGNVRFV